MVTTNGTVRLSGALVESERWNLVFRHGSSLQNSAAQSYPTFALVTAAPSR